MLRMPCICICSVGDPCDYHAATCRVCGNGCTGHPVVLVVPAPAPTNEITLSDEEERRLTIEVGGMGA